MPRSIFEIFDSKAIAAYWENLNVNMDDPMIGEKWFPNQKQVGLELAWIKGRNNLPVALQPSSFDTKATLRDKIGVSEVSTNMPFFREADRLSEKERQDIETLLAKGEAFAESTINRIFNVRKELIDGALVQPERMRMALLSTGQINIVATADQGRDVSYVYNFDTEGTWATDNNLVLTTTDRWTVANRATSRPIEDLVTAKNWLRQKRGVKAVTALMNSTTLAGLLASDSIAKAINPVGYTNMVILQKQLEEAARDWTGLNFEIYDKMYKDEQGVDQNFYPDGYVALLPSYGLGNTHFGTTPEEFDLMNGGTEASTTIVNTGTAVTTYKEPHPVNIVTVVSEIVLPSYERMDDVYILKVF